MHKRSGPEQYQGELIFWGYCTSQSQQQQIRQRSLGYVLLLGFTGFGSDRQLSSLRRGPFQTAGIHDLVAVGSFGLFGYPLINQILRKGAGKATLKQTIHGGESSTVRHHTSESTTLKMTSLTAEPDKKSDSSTGPSQSPSNHTGKATTKWSLGEGKTREKLLHPGICKPLV